MQAAKQATRPSQPPPCAGLLFEDYEPPRFASCFRKLGCVGDYRRYWPLLLPLWGGPRGLRQAPHQRAIDPAFAHAVVPLGVHQYPLAAAWERAEVELPLPEAVVEAQRDSLERYVHSLVAPLLAGAAQQQGAQQQAQGDAEHDAEVEAEVESMWQQEPGAEEQRTSEQRAVRAEVGRVGRMLRWLSHSPTPPSAQQHAACLAHLERAGSLEDDLPQAWQELAAAWPADVQAAWQEAVRWAQAQTGGG